MTKRHFIALANCIKWQNSHNAKREQFTIAQLEMLATFCQGENVNFNRERWLAYIAGTCGANGGTIKPPSKLRTITPERKLARWLEGK